MRRLIILSAVLISCIVPKIAMAQESGGGSHGRTAISLDSKTFVVVKDLSEDVYKSRILLFRVENNKIVLVDKIELQEIEHATNRTTRVYRHSVVPQ